MANAREGKPLGRQGAALTESDQGDLAAQLARATAALLAVAQRLDQTAASRPPIADGEGDDAPAVDSPKPRRRKPRAERALDDEPARAIPAAGGGSVGGGVSADTARVETNAPSDEVFGRFFAKVLELYQVDLKRRADERARRFHSNDREEALREIQATIDAVFGSERITNAEKNEALRMLIRQIVPYEERIEITYW